MRARLGPQDRAGWAFAGPVLLAITLFFLVPAFVALLLSLTDFDIYALADWHNLRWAGAGNYLALAGNPLFWRALGNTLLLALFGVPLSLGASLGVALLLNHPLVRWRAMWRVLLFAPYVTTLVATAIAWRYVLDTRFGLLNRALAAIGVAPVDWLGDPRASLPAIVLFIAWKNFGYNMILFSAALGAVPRDLLDAVRLDGAGAWGRFRHVTLPAIGPTLLLAALLSVAGNLQVFSEPYVLTRGGPAQSTQTLLYYMFEEGFRWWNLGTASAVALIVLLLTVLVTGFQVRLGRKREWL